jgi:hypothetical protein
MPPPRNDTRNDTTAACPVCGAPFTRTGRRRYCTDACRQAAWRHRTATRPPAIPLQPRRSRRDGTIYECTSCQARYLSDQWCPECSRPCRRLGPGGHCACGELLTIDELLNGS